MEIQVQLEDLSSVRKKLHVQIPAQVALEEFDRIARDYRSHARLPGFRAGKAPVGLVKRHFIKDIRNEVLRSLIPKSYQQALQQHEIVPLHEPDLDEVVFTEGQPLAYVAEFEVRPEVRLGDTKGLRVTALSPEIPEEEIDAQLEKLRQRHATLEAVEDRPAQDGDYALIDLLGEYADQAAEGAPEPPPVREEGLTVHIGGENTQEAFSEALRGMQIAEEKRFEVSYPADYPKKEIAGRTIRFTVQVTDIKVKKLPELNDEFARDAGDFADLADLKARVRKDLQLRGEQRREADIRGKLVDKLIEATPFDVPGVLVEAQIDRRLSELARNLVAQGTDPFQANVDWRKLREDLRPGAEKAVRADLILAELARREEIAVSDEELGEELAKIAQSMDQPVEKIRQHFQKEDRMADLAADMRRRKALDFLVSHATIA